MSNFVFSTGPVLRLVRVCMHLAYEERGFNLNDILAAFIARLPDKMDCIVGGRVKLCKYDVDKRKVA